MKDGGNKLPILRIIEWFGLEETFKGHLVQPPCHEQGHLQPDQVAQSSLQPGLECFQGWGLHYLSGQPVQVFHHAHCKKYPPCVEISTSTNLSTAKATLSCPPQLLRSLKM